MSGTEEEGEYATTEASTGGVRYSVSSSDWEAFQDWRDDRDQAEWVEETSESKSESPGLNLMAMGLGSPAAMNPSAQHRMLKSYAKNAGVSTPSVTQRPPSATGKRTALPAVTPASALPLPQSTQSTHTVTVPTGVAPKVTRARLHSDYVQEEVSLEEGVKYFHTFTGAANLGGSALFAETDTYNAIGAKLLAAAKLANVDSRFFWPNGMDSERPFNEIDGDDQPWRPSGFSLQMVHTTDSGVMAWWTIVTGWPEDAPLFVLVREEGHNNVTCQGWVSSDDELRKLAHCGQPSECTVAIRYRERSISSLKDLRDIHYMACSYPDDDCPILSWRTEEPAPPAAEIAPPARPLPPLSEALKSLWRPDEKGDWFHSDPLGAFSGGSNFSPSWSKALKANAEREGLHRGLWTIPRGTALGIIRAAEDSHFLVASIAEENQAPWEIEPGVATYLAITPATRYGEILGFLHRNRDRLPSGSGDSPAGLVMIGWAEVADTNDIATLAEVDLHRAVSEDWQRTDGRGEAAADLHVELHRCEDINVVLVRLCKRHAGVTNRAPAHCLVKVKRDWSLFPARRDSRILRARRESSVHDLTILAARTLEPWAKADKLRLKTSSFLEPTSPVGDIWGLFVHGSLSLSPAGEWSYEEVGTEISGNYRRFTSRDPVCWICKGLKPMTKKGLALGSFVVLDCGHRAHSECVSSLKTLGEPNCVQCGSPELSCHGEVPVGSMTDPPPYCNGCSGYGGPRPLVWSHDSVRSLKWAADAECLCLPEDKDEDDDAGPATDPKHLPPQSAPPAQPPARTEEGEGGGTGGSGKANGTRECAADVYGFEDFKNAWISEGTNEDSVAKRSVNTETDSLVKAVSRSFLFNLRSSGWTSASRDLARFQCPVEFLPSKEQCISMRGCLTEWGGPELNSDQAAVLFVARHWVGTTVTSVSSLGHLWRTVEKDAGYAGALKKVEGNQEAPKTNQQADTDGLREPISPAGLTDFGDSDSPMEAEEPTSPARLSAFNDFSSPMWTEAVKAWRAAAPPAGVKKPCIKNARGFVLSVLAPAGIEGLLEEHMETLIGANRWGDGCPKALRSLKAAYEEITDPKRYTIPLSSVTPDGRASVDGPVTKEPGALVETAEEDGGLSSGRAGTTSRPKAKAPLPPASIPDQERRKRSTAAGPGAPRGRASPGKRAAPAESKREVDAALAGTESERPETNLPTAEALVEMWNAVKAAGSEYRPSRAAGMAEVDKSFVDALRTEMLSLGLAPEWRMPGSTFFARYLLDPTLAAPAEVKSLAEALEAARARKTAVATPPTGRKPKKAKTIVPADRAEHSAPPSPPATEPTFSVDMSALKSRAEVLWDSLTASLAATSEVSELDANTAGARVTRSRGNDLEALKAEIETLGMGGPSATATGVLLLLEALEDEEADRSQALNDVVGLFVALRAARTKTTPILQPCSPDSPPQALTAMFDTYVRGWSADRELMGRTEAWLREDSDGNGALSDVLARAALLRGSVPDTIRLFSARIANDNVRKWTTYIELPNDTLRKDVDACDLWCHMHEVDELWCCVGEVQLGGWIKIWFSFDNMAATAIGLDSDAVVSVIVKRAGTWIAALTSTVSTIPKSKRSTKTAEARFALISLAWAGGLIDPKTDVDSTDVMCVDGTNSAVMVSADLPPPPAQTPSFPRAAPKRPVAVAGHGRTGATNAAPPPAVGAQGDPEARTPDRALLATMADGTLQSAQEPLESPPAGAEDVLTEADVSGSVGDTTPAGMGPQPLPESEETPSFGKAVEAVAEGEPEVPPAVTGSISPAETGGREIPAPPTVGNNGEKEQGQAAVRPRRALRHLTSLRSAWKARQDQAGEDTDWIDTSQADSLWKAVGLYLWMLDLRGELLHPDGQFPAVMISRSHLQSEEVSKWGLDHVARAHASLLKVCPAGESEISESETVAESRSEGLSPAALLQAAGQLGPQVKVVAEDVPRYHLLLVARANSRFPPMCSRELRPTGKPDFVPFPEPFCRWAFILWPHWKHGDWAVGRSTIENSGHGIFTRSTRPKGSVLFPYEGQKRECDDPKDLPEEPYTLFDEESRTVTVGGPMYRGSLVNHRGEPGGNATIARRGGGDLPGRQRGRGYPSPTRGDDRLRRRLRNRAVGSQGDHDHSPPGGAGGTDHGGRPQHKFETGRNLQRDWPGNGE